MSVIQHQPTTSPERGMSQYTVILEPPYPPGWGMPMHRHVQCELCLVKSGRCIIRINGKDEYFQANELLFVPSGIPHDFYAQPPSGVEFVVIQFLAFNEDLLCHLINTPPVGRFKLSNLAVNIFLEFCHKLQRELISALPFAEVECRALLEELAVFLLRGNNISFTSLLPEQREVIENALRFMHERSHESLHIREIAKEFGLSSQHFRKLFKNYLGISPKQYLTTLKIQRSKCLLLHREHSVTEVAMALGFSSTQQFSKVFRKVTGFSPSTWRNMYLLEHNLTRGVAGKETGDKKRIDRI